MHDPKPMWLGTFRLRADLRDPNAWTENDTSAVGDHFTRLQHEATKGTVLFAGRTDDRDENDWLAEDTLGLVVFEAGDRVAAEAFMADDPAVQAGVMTSAIQSYRLAVARHQGA
jgi:uncharacterized protein YciI